MSTDTRRVVLHNDDTTSAVFVIAVAHDVFGLPYSEAIKVTAAVHGDGAAIVGEYDAVEAQSKVSELATRSQSEGYELRATVEPADWENTEQANGSPVDENTLEMLEFLAFMCQSFEDTSISFKIAVVDGVLQVRQLEIPEDEPEVQIKVKFTPNSADDAGADPGSPAAE
jgi:ATP-dependent Clp protease adapter protein ClpS